MITYPFPVKYCSVGNAIEIAYCEVGTGEQTLLFLHGLGNYLPVFKHNLDGLNTMFRCIALDLPGNGLSSPGDFPHTMAFYAEVVAQFIAANGLDRVVVAGHSMGGHVAMMLALHYPQHVSSLVLLAPSGIEYYSDFERILMKSFLNFGGMMYGDESSLRAAIENSYYHEKRKDARIIISDLIQLMQGKQKQYWQPMLKRNMESMLDDNMLTFLPQIVQPVLLLFGLQDGFIPNKFVHVGETPETLAKKAQQQFPNCKIEILHQCGHFLQIEQAEKVNQLIMEFLDKKIP